jgi:hypothetical protein
VSSLWLFASLLIVPGLIGFPLLMSWLEIHFTHRLVAHEVAVAWQSALTTEELEEAISRSVARVMPVRH